MVEGDESRREIGVNAEKNFRKYLEITMRMAQTDGENSILTFSVAKLRLLIANVVRNEREALIYMKNSVAGDKDGALVDEVLKGFKTTAVPSRTFMDLGVFPLRTMLMGLGRKEAANELINDCLEKPEGNISLTFSPKELKEFGLVESGSRRAKYLSFIGAVEKEKTGGRGRRSSKIVIAFIDSTDTDKPGWKVYNSGPIATPEKELELLSRLRNMVAAGSEDLKEKIEKLIIETRKDDRPVYKGVGGFGDNGTDNTLKYGYQYAQLIIELHVSPEIFTKIDEAMPPKVRRTRG